MKTLLTKAIERGALSKFAKLGTFLCPEVGITTIDTYEKTYNIHNEDFTNIFHERKTEIVDILAWNTKGDWYCYEIKITKQDFYSKCKKTFIGNYNYYIMPQELLKQVYKDIPVGIGVYVIDDLHSTEDKKIPFKSISAKRQELKVDEKILTYSMIKSLYREFQSKSDEEFDYLKRTINNLKKQKNDLEKCFNETNKKLYDKEYCPHCENLKFDLKIERNVNERLRKKLETIKVSEE